MQSPIARLLAAQIIGPLHPYRLGIPKTALFIGTFLDIDIYWCPNGKLLYSRSGREWLIGWLLEKPHPLKEAALFVKELKKCRAQLKSLKHERD